MDTITLSYHGQTVALAARARFWLAAHIEALPTGHPDKQHVCFMALYARDVLTASCPAPTATTTRTASPATRSSPAPTAARRRATALRARPAVRTARRPRRQSAGDAVLLERAPAPLASRDIADRRRSPAPTRALRRGSGNTVYLDHARGRGDVLAGPAREEQWNGIRR